MWKNVEQNYVEEFCELRKSSGLIQRQFGALKNCMWRNAAAKIVGIYTTSFFGLEREKLKLVWSESCFGLMTSMKCEWEVEVPKKSGLDKIKRKNLVSYSPNVYS